MKYKLYDDIKNYCEVNKYWKAYNTAKDWNEILGTTYSPATFTAAAKSGLLVREKFWGDKSYSYKLYVEPTPEEIQEEKEIAERRAEAKRQEKIENAKWWIEHYDEEVANIKAYYEEEIRKAEESMKKSIGWKNERLAEAKALLNII